MEEHKLEELIRGLKAGDKTAFQTLYEMYSDAVCGAINAVVKDTSRAEELCQDVFLTVWNKSEQYNASKGRFFTWILNIGRNRAIDHLRSKAYKQEKGNLSTDNLVGMVEDPGDEAPNSHPAADKLSPLIKGLSEKCRQIIEYLYFRGYTQKAVSEELNVPLGTVKTRNRDCVGHLRKFLKP